MEKYYKHIKDGYFKISIYILLITLLFSRCEKVATNVDLPDADPQLVLFCFISPQDSLIKAKLNLSRPIYNNTNKYSNSYVTDAVILITDKTDTAILKYSSKDRFYYTDSTKFKIRTGKTYYIYASTPDGKKISSNCKVPEKNTQIFFKKYDSISDYSIKNYLFNFNFADIPNLDNYYRVIFAIKSEHKHYLWNSSYTISYSYDRYEFDFGNELVNDKDKDGNTFEYSVRIPEFVMPNSENKRKAVIYLYSTDENYYIYHNSLRNYSDDNTFNEPTQIKSNIDNGLGLFAASNKYYIEINI